MGELEDWHVGDMACRRRGSAEGVLIQSLRAAGGARRGRLGIAPQIARASIRLDLAANPRTLVALRHLQ